ncbi:MAG: hypothetical protein KIT19_12810 [Phycisphaeraceae bacterium]|nr:hypothetical protein [Phycisphaeraceae bacterium]
MRGRLAAVERRIDARAFYWAVLCVPDRTSRSKPARRRVLEHLLDTELPLPVERVQATYLELGAGRVLACAMDHETLAGLVAGDPISLGPDAFPHWLSNEDGMERHDSSRLNLLFGALEPGFLVRARRRRVRRISAIAMLAMLALITGMERRRVEAARMLRESEHRVATLANELTPASASLPASMRLAAESRRAGHAAQEATDSPHPRSAWPMLRAVLLSWPEGVWLESARSDGATIAITLGADDAAAIGGAVERIAGASGLHTSQPTITMGVADARASVTLSQAAGDAGGSR